ncbi:MAG TPA: peptide ABC transporter ATP-binding protein [Eubacterium sp.]|nr:peptide ABC transporter ATP-binding protein [Eubacterium sp.]
MKDNNVILEVKDLHKSFGEQEVLKGISTEVNRGDVIAIIGPSGCGKSTFLRSLNLLETPTSGQILFEGTDLTDKSTDINVTRQKIGMVFQQFNLFANMTIKANIMLAPVKLGVMTKDEASNKADELLTRIGLLDKADAYPAQLSGGQKQRVAIARAMVNHPKLLLADEPTGALDSKSGKQVLELFESLNESGVTVVVITHDRKVAEQAKRIVHIIDGEITEEGQEAGNEKEKEN